MKLLVTGGAGFIGSNFIRYWLTKHPTDKIINYDALTYAGCRESLFDVEKSFPNNYIFVQGDIRDNDTNNTTLEEHKPDIIINFAAESHNSYAILNPGIFMETNALGTQRLLEAARRHAIPRFHHISTCEVYGDLALDSKESFSETSPYRPRTPYNAAKAAADMIVKAYFETFNLPITISNCANNYGPYQFPEKLIPNFTIKALQGKPLPLYLSSQNKREWIHVIDHCEAIELIILHGQIGHTYNVGTGIEADVETIADTILKAFNLDESFKKYVPDRPGHDRRYLLNSTKLRTELGWQPRHTFETALQETIQWYRDNESWWKPLVERVPVAEETQWKQ